MVNIKDLTGSIETAGEVDPTIERWLKEAKSLQLKLSERVLLLCLYVDHIPEQALSKYADALLDALRDEELEKEFSIPTRLNRRIDELVRRLESSGEPEKATFIREAISGRLNNNR